MPRRTIRRCTRSSPAAASYVVPAYSLRYCAARSLRHLDRTMICVALVAAATLVSRARRYESGAPHRLDSARPRDHDVGRLRPAWKSSAALLAGPRSHDARLRARRADVSALYRTLDPRLALEPGGHLQRRRRAEGYWTSSAAPGTAIVDSFGYRLPHRGSTHDQGDDDTTRASTTAIQTRIGRAIRISPARTPANPTPCTHNGSSSIWAACSRSTRSTLPGESVCDEVYGAVLERRRGRDHRPGQRALDRFPERRGFKRRGDGEGRYFGARRRHGALGARADDPVLEHVRLARLRRPPQLRRLRDRRHRLGTSTHRVTLRTSCSVPRIRTDGDVDLVGRSVALRGRPRDGGSGSARPRHRFDERHHARVAGDVSDTALLQYAGERGKRSSLSRGTALPDRLHRDGRGDRRAVRAPEDYAALYVQFATSDPRRRPARVKSAGRCSRGSTPI